MTEHPNIEAALVAALAELTVVEKGRTADMKTYKYDYADLADVVKVTRPVLAAHGLTALTPVHGHGAGLACTVIILHASGSRLDLGPFPFPHGRDAQATGSMVTYHRRYSLLAALGMAAGDDDDGALAVAKEHVAVALQRTAPPAPTSEFLEVFNDLTPEVKNKILPWLRERGHKPSTVPDDLMPDIFEFIASLEVVPA